MAGVDFGHYSCHLCAFLSKVCQFGSLWVQNYRAKGIPCRGKCSEIFQHDASWYVLVLKFLREEVILTKIMVLEFLQEVQRLSKEWGKCFRIWLGPDLLIVVTDAKKVEVSYFGNKGLVL